MKWRECQVTSPEGGGPVTRCHGQNYVEHPVVILFTQVLARGQRYRGHPVPVGRGARGPDPGGHLHVGTRPRGGGRHGLEEAGHPGRHGRRLKGSGRQILDPELMTVG